MIKAIFFDNDGVLVDTEHLYLEASRATRAEVGVALDEAAFVDLSLRQGRSVFDRTALVRAGCAAHEAVAIEDSERGLAAARSPACTGCWSRARRSSTRSRS